MGGCAPSGSQGGREAGDAASEPRDDASGRVCGAGAPSGAGTSPGRCAALAAGGGIMIVGELLVILLVAVLASGWHERR